MRFFKSIILLVFFFNAAGYVTGQNLEILPTESTSEDEVEIKTLHSQFQILRDKSNTFQEYKVVKVTNLNNFWNNVKDSIDVQKIITCWHKKKSKTKKLFYKNFKKNMISRMKSYKKAITKKHILLY